MKQYFSTGDDCAPTRGQQNIVILFVVIIIIIICHYYLSLLLLLSYWWWRHCAIDSEWVEARDSAENFIMHHVITLQTKYYLAPNDNCVILEKSFSSYICIYWDLFFQLYWLMEKISKWISDANILLKIGDQCSDMWIGALGQLGRHPIFQCSLPKMWLSCPLP